MEKKQILNIMVDLETASIKENAAILSWAMVAFTTDGSECDIEPFYKTVNLTSCFMTGMSIEQDTQDWWLKQSPESRAVILMSEGEDILPVTREAYCWLSALAEKYDLYMWCRGIDFDLPKIEWCFRIFLEQNAPYKYSHKMDVRTVLKFMQIDQTQFQFEGVKHNALHDCRHDIKMVQAAYDMLRRAFNMHKADEANKFLKEVEKNSKLIYTKDSDYKSLKRIVPIPLCKLNGDKGLGFSWKQLAAINDKIQELEEANRVINAANKELANQIEKFYKN
jgi:hypothetical protein